MMRMMMTGGREMKEVEERINEEGGERERWIEGCWGERCQREG